MQSPALLGARPWRRAFTLVLGLALLGWFAFSAARSMDRRRAAERLRTMGFEAGSPDIMTRLRTNWRGFFDPKSRPWHDRVRLMGSGAENLDAYRSDLHRFEPRGVLLGFCRNLTDVSALHGLPGLERLDFYECPNINDIEIVSEFTGLKELTFSNSPTLRTLAIIKSGTNLTSLHITGCVDLDDLEALQGLTSLRSLYLTGNAALKNAEFLRHLVLLEELDLSTCRKLANLDGLHELKSLKTVNLRGCAAVKPEAVARLRTALPGAKIDYP